MHIVYFYHDYISFSKWQKQITIVSYQLQLLCNLQCNLYCRKWLPCLDLICDDNTVWFAVDICLSQFMITRTGKSFFKSKSSKNRRTERTALVTACKLGEITLNCHINSNMNSIIFYSTYCMMSVLLWSSKTDRICFLFLFFK